MKFLFTQLDITFKLNKKDKSKLFSPTKRVNDVNLHSKG